MGTYLEAKNTPYESITELTESTASYVFLIHPSDGSSIIKHAEPSVKVIAVEVQALWVIPKSVLPCYPSRFSIRGTISPRSQGQGLGSMAVGLLRIPFKRCHCIYVGLVVRAALDCSTVTSGPTRRRVERHDYHFGGSNLQGTGWNIRQAISRLQDQSHMCRCHKSWKSAGALKLEIDQEVQFFSSSMQRQAVVVANVSF